MATTSTEKSLASVSLWISIGGAAWGFFILLATGMSNVRDAARRDLLMAFPVPTLALVLSIAACAVSVRRDTFDVCGSRVVAAFVIAAGTILLALAAIRSYL